MFDAKSILEGLVRNAAPPQQAQGGGGGLADIFAEILKGGGNQQQPGAGAPGGSAGGGGLGDILGEISRRMTQPGQAGSQAGEATNAVPGGGSGGLEDIFAQIQAKLNQAGGAVAGPNAGSITDILGKVLTQATQGAQEGASKIGQATGATDAMRGAVGRATGQTPGDLMQQIKDLIQQNPMMAGTVAGGLGGLLLGPRTGRSLAGTAAQAGALTLIGGLAYKAFQNYQAGRPLITGATPAEAAPQGSGFGPAAQTNNMALHYIQAMIAAASARVACTSSGGRMLGRMWNRAMRHRGLPTARAASM